MKKIKISISVSLLCMLIGCCFFAFNFFIKTNNVNAEIFYDVPAIEREYGLNESRTLPNNITVEYENKTYNATNGVVVFPGNLVKSIGGAPIRLNVAGKCFVKYFFTSESGKFVTVIDEFIVSYDKFGFSVDNDSSCEIIKDDNLICENNNDNSLYSGNNGMILRIYSGCTFNYNVPLDLSKNVNDNGLSEILSIDPRLNKVHYVGNEKTDESGFVVDENGNLKKDVFGNAYKNQGNNIYAIDGVVAENVVIRLTDCYDSLKYLDIVLDCKDEDYAGITYMRGRIGGDSKSYGGWAESDAASTYQRAECFQDGVRGLIYTDRFGIAHSGRNYIATDRPITLCYDTITQRLYYKRGTDIRLIVDFSNETLFGNKKFSGFTTGEVFLSLFCENYLESDFARIDVLSIGGNVDDVTSLKDGIYNDTTDPKVEIIIDKTNDLGVYAAKGETFTIPETVVKDVNFNNDLTIRVYKNFGEKNQSIINVQDNKFIVDEVATFTIVYTATDIYGNKGINYLNVVGVNEKNSLGIVVEKLENIKFAQKNILPNYLVSTINDKEKINVEIYAEKDGRKIAINANTQEFIPQELGEYCINYLVSDNLNSIKYSYYVNCITNERTVFMDKPFLYTHYLKNAEYSFEPLYALQKQSDGTYDSLQAECYISFDGGEYQKVTDLSQVKISGSKSLTVKYFYDGVYSETSTALIVDVGFNTDSLSLKDYFLGDFNVDTINGDGISVKNDIVYESIATKGNNKLRFVNPINYQDFKFEYFIPTRQDNFEKLNVILIDGKNSENKVKISIRNFGKQALCSVNGSTEIGIGEKFSGGYSINIKYNYDRGFFLVGNGKTAFNMDFAGDFAYLELELEKITGNSAINVKTLNNVSFYNSTKSDIFAPEIWTKKLYGRYEIGEIITLSPMCIKDVLSPINVKSRSIRVEMPSRNFAQTVDGRILNGKQDYSSDLKIALTEYGTYNVYYSGSDLKGNPCSLLYSFVVVDKIAPTIELQNEFNEINPCNIKKGERINVKYSVSDNLTESDKLDVLINVLDNQSGLILINTNTEIKFEKSGTYTVYIYCTDEDGNSACRFFNVLVK